MTSRSEREAGSPAAQAAGFFHVRVGSRLRRGFSLEQSTGNPLSRAGHPDLGIFARRAV